jgi:hypothetical protein
MGAPQHGDAPRVAAPIMPPLSAPVPAWKQEGAAKPEAAKPESTKPEGTGENKE